MPMLVVLSTVQVMYLYRTTSLMLRIFLKKYFLLNVEILQGNSAVFSILHLLIILITSA